jgi:hypothetical protein
MHIYRLAAEVGLMKLDTYMDRALAERIDAESRREETERLQHLPRDLSQWGYWAAEIHESFIQKNRQWRAYVYVYTERLAEQRGNDWIINGWSASLEHCHCPDFAERRLPCKHMYGVATLSGIALPLSPERYAETVARGEELFFHLWGEARVKAHPDEEILRSKGQSVSGDPQKGISIRISLDSSDSAKCEIIRHEK